MQSIGNYHTYFNNLDLTSIFLFWMLYLERPQSQKFESYTNVSGKNRKKTHTKKEKQSTTSSTFYISLVYWNWFTERRKIKQMLSILFGYIKLETDFQISSSKMNHRYVRYICIFTGSCQNAFANYSVLLSWLHH